MARKYKKITLKVKKQIAEDSDMKFCSVTRELCKNAVKDKLTKNLSCGIFNKNILIKDIKKCPLVTGEKNETQRCDVVR